MTHLYAVVKRSVDHGERDLPWSQANRLKPWYRQPITGTLQLPAYRHRRVASWLQDADRRDGFPSQPLRQRRRQKKERKWNRTWHQNKVYTRWTWKIGDSPWCRKGQIILGKNAHTHKHTRTIIQDCLGKTRTIIKTPPPPIVGIGVVSVTGTQDILHRYIHHPSALPNRRLNKPFHFMIARHASKKTNKKKRSTELLTQEVHQHFKHFKLVTPSTTTETRVYIKKKRVDPSLSRTKTNSNYYWIIE